MRPKLRARFASEDFLRSAPPKSISPTEKNKTLNFGQRLDLFKVCFCPRWQASRLFLTSVAFDKRPQHLQRRAKQSGSGLGLGLGFGVGVTNPCASSRARVPPSGCRPPPAQSRAPPCRRCFRPPPSCRRRCRPWRASSPSRPWLPVNKNQTETRVRQKPNTSFICLRFLGPAQYISAIALTQTPFLVEGHSLPA